MAYLDILNDPSFFLLLLEMDFEATKITKEKGCVFCGGKLDVANDRRKIRGAPPEVAEVLGLRNSLCCRQDGCRKRHKPSSVVFFDRKSWPACIFVVASFLAGDTSPQGTADFLMKNGLSSRLLKRWRRWWNEQFSCSMAWRRLRGFLSGRFTLPILSGLFTYFDLIERLEPDPLSRMLVFLEGRNA